MIQPTRESPRHRNTDGQSPATGYLRALGERFAYLSVFARFVAAVRDDYGNEHCRLDNWLSTTPSFGNAIQSP